MLQLLGTATVLIALLFQGCRGHTASPQGQSRHVQSVSRSQTSSNLEDRGLLAKGKDGTSGSLMALRMTQDHSSKVEVLEARPSLSIKVFYSVPQESCCWAKHPNKRPIYTLIHLQGTHLSKNTRENLLLIYKHHRTIQLWLG